MKRYRGALLLLLLLCLLASSLSSQAETLVREWTPEELGKWAGGHARKLSVADGALVVETVPGDPIWTGPVFEGFPATPWQVLELTMKTDVSGPGDIFWTGTTQTQYGGFSGEKKTGFDVIGDGAFHTYRIEPFWQAEKKILRLRLDLPEKTGGRYTIRSLRVVEEGRQDPVQLPLKNLALSAEGTWHARVAMRAEESLFIHLRMAVSAGEMGTLSFASSTANGLKKLGFPLRTDGRMHTYNLDMGADRGWAGEIVGLRLDLAPSKAKGARIQVESISAGVDAQGPADLEARWVGLSDPWARAGRPVRLDATLINRGGETARGIRAQLSLRGARLLESKPVPDSIEFDIPQTVSWNVQADQPGEAEAVLRVGETTATLKLQFREPLNLPKAAYVPEPKPAKSDYLVGAYLFPGWNTASAWARIKPYPERQPLLGWYREELPEVADWQIKWATEHGINFFLYDWYWDRGHRHHEHGLHSALFNAKYQNLIQFCLLYANHNGAGSHSAEDFEAIARFWIDNYFKRPNYLKVEGKPVIVMFAPMNPPRDMGGTEPVKASFDKMRALCREAGLGGIYFVACSPPDVQRLPALKEMGYDAVTAYNWPSLNMTEPERAVKRGPFSTCIEGYAKAWSEIASANTLKLIPPVCGGWDARPWHGESTLVRTGRNPELFQKHLEDCKRFLDAQEQDPKLKMLFVEAWNEWGEGSYIEPHREFGFGYLESIRKVFAPSSPKPAEFVPADYGLGPYNIAETSPVTAWDFSKAKDTLGWSGNVLKSKIETSAWQFTTSGRDPIVSSPVFRARASRFPEITIRLKSNRNVAGQLFWLRLGTTLSEAASVRFPIVGDGEFHDIKLSTANHPQWRGYITELRLDPGNEDGVEVAIESIRLVEDAPAK